jgi:hypothetical protein
MPIGAAIAAIVAFISGFAVAIFLLCKNFKGLAFSGLMRRKKCDGRTQVIRLSLDTFEEDTKDNETPKRKQVDVQSAQSAESSQTSRRRLHAKP